VCVSARLNALVYGMPKCWEEGRMNIFIMLVWTFVSTNCFLKLFFIPLGEITINYILMNTLDFFIDGFCTEIIIKLLHLSRDLPSSHTVCFFPSTIFCLCVSLGKMLKDFCAVCFSWWDIQGIGRSEVSMEGTQPTTLICP